MRLPAPGSLLGCVAEVSQRVSGSERESLCAALTAGREAIALLQALRRGYSHDINIPGSDPAFLSFAVYCD